MNRLRIPFNVPLAIMAVSWGFNFVSMKALYRQLDPMAVFLDRGIVIGLVLATICLVRKQPLRYPSWREAGRLLIAGSISLGVYMVLFMNGLNSTSPAEAAIMLATAPIFTFLLACAWKQEPFCLPAFGGSVVGFCGVVIVILGGSPAGGGSIVGNLLCLTSALVWAIGVVVLRPVLQQMDPMRAFTLSLPGALPLMVLFGFQSAIHADYAAITPFNWLMFAQVCLLSGVVAFLCFYIGIKQIGASRSTTYQFFVPPMAALFQWLFGGAPLSWIQYVGMLVLLGGVLTSVRARAQVAPPAPDLALEVG